MHLYGDVLIETTCSSHQPLYHVLLPATVHRHITRVSLIQSLAQRTRGSDYRVVVAICRRPPRVVNHDLLSGSDSTMQLSRVKITASMSILYGYGYNIAISCIRRIRVVPNIYKHAFSQYFVSSIMHSDNECTFLVF